MRILSNQASRPHSTEKRLPARIGSAERPRGAVSPHRVPRASARPPPCRTVDAPLAGRWKAPSQGKLPLQARGQTDPARLLSPIGPRAKAVPGAFVGLPAGAAKTARGQAVLMMECQQCDLDAARPSLPGTAGMGEPQHELGHGHRTFLSQAGLFDAIDIAHDKSTGDLYGVVPPHHCESLERPASPAG